MSFDEVRPYTPGDEVRLIDWNVTARTGDAFIKRFVEERELTVIVMADASLSMNFGLSSCSVTQRQKTTEIHDTKRELAAQIAAAIVLSAQMNNDRVGLITFGETVTNFIPPGKGRRHALRSSAKSLRWRPPAAATDLAGALAYLGRILKRAPPYSSFPTSRFPISKGASRGRQAPRHPRLMVRDHSRTTFSKAASSP